MRKGFKCLEAIASAIPLVVATPASGAHLNEVLAPATTLHSNPERDDNLRLYVMLEASGAVLSLDSAQPSPLETPSSVMFTMLPAGMHRAVVDLPGGVQASLDFTLAAEEQIESKGRRWWCLAIGRRDGQIKIVQLDAARCQSIAGAGPD